MGDIGRTASNTDTRGIVDAVGTGSGFSVTALTNTVNILMAIICTALLAKSTEVVIFVVANDTAGANTDPVELMLDFFAAVGAVSGGVMTGMEAACTIDRPLSGGKVIEILS